MERRWGVLLPLLAVALMAPSTAGAHHESTMRLSGRPMGNTRVLGWAANPAVSGDGGTVAFASIDRLTSDDTDSWIDVFVSELDGSLERVDVGEPWDADAFFEPPPLESRALSHDGRYLVFASSDPTLVDDDTNDRWDVYVLDRETGVIELVSRGSDGSPANGDSYGATISADGRYVSFISSAADIVPGDVGDHLDAFVADRAAGVIERVSVSTAGAEANDHVPSATISGDGRTVVFTSSATNLTSPRVYQGSALYARDLDAGTTFHASLEPPDTYILGTLFPDVSFDGRMITFTAFTYSLFGGEGLDIMTVDLGSGEAHVVSRTPSGDRANDRSVGSAISADGGTVVFYSSASNLVDGDLNQSWDTFVVDLDSSETALASVSSWNEQGYLGPFALSELGYRFARPAVSAHGSVVAFVTDLHGLVEDDLDGLDDVFVRIRSGRGCEGREPNGPISRRVHGLGSVAAPEPASELSCSVAETGL